APSAPARPGTPARNGRSLPPSPPTRCRRPPAPRPATPPPKTSRPGPPPGPTRTRRPDQTARRPPTPRPAPAGPSAVPAPRPRPTPPPASDATPAASPSSAPRSRLRPLRLDAAQQHGPQLRQRRIQRVRLARVHPAGHHFVDGAQPHVCGQLRVQRRDGTFRHGPVQIPPDELREPRVQLEQFVVES